MISLALQTNFFNKIIVNVWSKNGDSNSHIEFTCVPYALFRQHFGELLHVKRDSGVEVCFNTYNMPLNYIDSSSITQWCGYTKAQLNPKRSSISLGKYRKLSARYCGPYAITKKINDQAYQLQLPSHLKVHNVFHVSLLKKYVPDPSHILDDDHLITSVDGTFDIYPEAILQSRIRTLRNRSLNEYLIKWSSYSIEDATWEREDVLLQNYPDFLSR